MDGGEIVSRLYKTTRPPSRCFACAHTHELAWDDFRDTQPFDAAREGMAPALKCEGSPGLQAAGQAEHGDDASGKRGARDQSSIPECARRP
jgi:hypothetical protein